MLRDVRPEDEERRVADEEVQSDPRGQQPDPSVLGERLPPLAQLAEEVRRCRAAHPCRQADPGQQQGARRIGAAVHEQRRAAADRRDDRAARRRAEREREVARDPHQRVRLLQLPRLDQFRNEPARCRRVERRRRAAESLQDEDLPDARVAADQEQAHGCAHADVGSVGADHHEATRQTVRDHTSDEERGDLRQCPAREGDAGVARRAGQVEDRKRDRNWREVGPEIRDRAGGEQQPEVAVPKQHAASPSSAAARRTTARTASPARMPRARCPRPLARTR